LSRAGFRGGSDVVFFSFVIDAYSRKVVG